MNYVMKPVTVVALVAIAAAGLLAACGGDDDDARGGEILVAAAADLRFAFEEIEPIFERQCECTVTMSFGSSGNFTTQIEGGLPADVFFSANSSFIDSLESKGLILEGTNQLYAVGRIVLAKNKGVNAKVVTMADLLKPEIRSVSIANPDHAPYGVAAQEALTSAGLWDEVRPRLVLGENASQATQFVEAGDAQAGIVPLSLAIRLTDKLDYLLIDASEHNPLLQGTGVVKSSKNPDVARGFIDFVNSEEGQVIMAKYGFEAPN